MKTFREFILICEKLSKTHDEDSQNKLWNYFIANSDNTKIRDLILNKDFEEAEKEIKKEVEAAKNNPEHPLNFKNAGNEEFSKKEGRQSSDEQSYNDFLDDSVSGLLALSKQKKLRSAIEKGFPSRVTGSSSAELSKEFRKSGGVDKTPKGDLEIYNPDNPKDRRGISMKKGAGAQLASAEGGELKGMYKIAAKEYVRRFHSNKSKEERKRIEKEIMNDAERLSAIGRLQKTAGEAPDEEKQKQSLKNASQGISDKLIDKYPQFERLLSQVATSGKGKFKGDEGTAGIVLTGKNKGKEATAKPAEQQKSAKPRLALPKGRMRPGNLKIDYRPEEPVSRQSSFSDFSKRAQQAQKDLQAADAEAQNAAAEVQNASVPIDPETGAPIPRQYRKNAEVHMSVDPTSPTAVANLGRRAEAQAKLNQAQSNQANAAANLNQVQAAAAEIANQAQPKKSPKSTQQAPTQPTQQAPAQPTQPQPTQPTQQTQPAPEQPQQQTQVAQPQQTQPAPEQQQQQPAPEQQKPKPKKKKPEPENTETGGQAPQ